MGRTSVRAAAVLTVAALLTGTASAAFGAESVEEVTIPTPVDATGGQYIVVLDEEPLAGYEGGVPGIAPTKPSKGDKLDAHTSNARKYIAHLAKKQGEIADDAGVTPDAAYQVTFNGFSAALTGDQVAELRATKGVIGVYPDEIRHPTAAQQGTEFLGLEGGSGVWDAVGGTAEAGEGVVVGVIDTGISPDNPSFAGDKLGSKRSEEPFLQGNTIVFEKSDGTQFRSERMRGQNWSSQDYSTKLIGAQYFSSGAKAAGFKFTSDFLSPRDGDGHGSHTASTAAGNHGVEASIEGIDFGAISGVAPAAKIASYKACWVGPDPLSTDDDICATSDLLAAIDQAVADGVDVINYSIGGGSATSILAVDDVSFFYAAIAGVFVSASAGNSGPGASTADHASPWYTTVAASTIPTWEGTVELPNGDAFAGASVTVPFGDSLTGAAVYAGDIPASGVAAEEAALCTLGSIDPAAAAGKIVVCDRGVIARVEKSQAVDEAGGIGMVLVNVTPGSLDNDFHSVPTVHVADTARDAIVDYVQGAASPELTLVGENTTGIETPVPQVAGFSSRGPMLADGSDVIKPDISAPGVAILAATHNAKNTAPTYGILSGTSMSAPHIAGLAALYLGERPLATPAEIKSAMMTTAYDTVDAEGAAATDPFAQGAGHVDPTRFFEPGLLYLQGALDWAAYIEAALGEDVFAGVDPMDDPSNLNLASIGIGKLAGPQMVTRTVTATADGSYTASVSGVDGIAVEVSPSSFTISEGETQEIEISFALTESTETEAWATGSLTLTSDDATVRSPIAVFPVTADAPEEVAGAVEDGSAVVDIIPGLSGDLPLNLSGLTPMELLVDSANPVDGHSGDENSGDAAGDIAWIVDIPTGIELSRFTLDSSDDVGSDLDLFVYHVVSPADLRYYDVWYSASGSADEEVTLTLPEAGTYLVIANMYSTTGPTTWDLWMANVATGASDGGFAAAPNPLAVTLGEPASYELQWSGLDADGRYLGVVQYGDSAVRTIVTVD
ncbi:hypothetical protein GCM10022200_19130 [Microbacterium awajiense]|uniref:Serine protease n=1 Tax=Microbacterium awajiense TaxID=415214 RepID=A0ABP7AMC3_9MICO